jgi:exocyst complex component 2
MREQGTTEPEEPPTAKRQHYRHASKSGPHGKSTSDPLSPNLGSNKPLPSDKKKNALVKESEYGVAGIKAPLLEVAVKAEEVWGPALGGRDKEETLKAILSSMEKNRDLFEVGASLQDAIRRKDHETIVEDYTRARKYADDARSMVESANYRRTPLSDDQVHQIIVTARMWADVDRQIELFKRDAWRTLTGMHFNKQQAQAEDKPEAYLELISIMLELGVEENPIWFWLLSRYDFLKNKISATCERSKVEIEILRRHLGNGEKPTLSMLALHLRSVGMQGRPGDTAKTDSAKVLEFWEHVLGSMNTLLSTQGGVLGEVVEYWETARSFIDGKAQKNLPIGIDGASRQHHRLSTAGVGELEKGVIELINVIREHLFSLFSDPPIEDVSLLFSPLPTTPLTPKTPLSAKMFSPNDSRFRFDANSAPPPSPSRGESWEKYAFWPPYSNALSGVHYLAKILVLIGAAASEMASLRLPERSETGVRMTELLKSLVGGVRERCVSAVCAAWNTDADKVKVLEDWTRSPERRDSTNLPSRFMALESALLGSMQKILYVSDAMSKPGSTDVVVPPSAKLLQMVRSQFVTSLYKTLSGMVENAEKGRVVIDDDWDEVSDELTVPAQKPVEDSSLSGIDASNQVRQSNFVHSNHIRLSLILYFHKY